MTLTKCSRTWFTDDCKDEFHCNCLFSLLFAALLKAYYQVNLESLSNTDRMAL